MKYILMGGLNGILDTFYEEDLRDFTQINRWKYC